jgi:hypothetical protein
MTVISKLEPASMPDHVSVDREAKPFRSVTETLHHPVEGIRGHRSAAFGQDREGLWAVMAAEDRADVRQSKSLTLNLPASSRQDG